jgi:hypothetical protein
MMSRSRFLRRSSAVSRLFFFAVALRFLALLLLPPPPSVLPPLLLRVDRIRILPRGELAASRPVDEGEDELRSTAVVARLRGDADDDRSRGDDDRSRGEDCGLLPLPLPGSDPRGDEVSRPRGDADGDDDLEDSEPSLSLRDERRLLRGERIGRSVSPLPREPALPGDGPPPPDEGDGAVNDDDSGESSGGELTTSFDLTSRELEAARSA